MQPNTSLAMINVRPDILSDYQQATNTYPNSYMLASDYAIVLSVANSWRQRQLIEKQVNHVMEILRGGGL